MDTPLPKPKWTNNRTYFVSVVAVVLGLLSMWAFRATGTSVSVERSKVIVAEVVLGDFHDIVPVSATVEPIRTVHLPAEEGGRVDEVFVVDGAMVEAGQPLLRLSNASLMLDFMNRETQIVEQLNNLRNTRILIGQNERNDREALMELDYRLGLISRKYAVDTSLFGDKLIARQQFEDSQDEFEHLQARKQFLEQSLAQDRAYRHVQLQRIDASLDLMERNLEAIRSNLENLTVKAPLAGQLTAFDFAVGETVAKGQNMGRIDVLTGFVASAMVDEHYLSKVQIGQQGEFVLAGQKHEVAVHTVHPEVVNGAFEVEFVFLREAPELRRGQSLQIKLALGSPVEAVLVPRGGFYRKTAGAWIYVVNDDKAVKVPVRLGRQNNEYIEVLEGLEPGQQVVISGYDNFGEADRLELK